MKFKSKPYELRKVPVFTSVYEFDDSGTEYIRTIDIHGSGLIQSALADWIKKNSIKVLRMTDNKELHEPYKATYISVQDYEDFFRTHREMIEQEDYREKKVTTLSTKAGSFLT
jgi:hypothetical protein